MPSYSARQNRGNHNEYTMAAPELTKFPHHPLQVGVIKVAWRQISNRSTTIVLRLVWGRNTQKKYFATLRESLKTRGQGKLGSRDRAYIKTDKFAFFRKKLCVWQPKFPKPNEPDLTHRLLSDTPNGGTAT